MKTLLPILKTKLFVLGFLSACTVILANNYIQRDNLFKFSETKEEKAIAKPEKGVVKTKKVADKKINLQLRERFGVPADASFTATVVSDKPDYAPGSTATFTGDGFAPNEDVVLKVKNLNQPCNTVAADSSYYPWTVTADENGHFVTTWTVCECPGDSLRLKATGQTSGLVAIALFSDAATISLTSSPASTPGTAPATLTICSGTSVTFTAAFQCTPGTAISKTYEWKIGGVTQVTHVVTTTSDTWTTSALTNGNVVTCNVIFDNLGGCNSSPESTPAITVTVNSTPSITTPPADQTVCSGGSVSFNVAATGGALSYQWKKGGGAGSNLVDGGNISGANTATLTINPATASDAAGTGSGYFVTVTNACGSTTSSKAALTINTAPSITTQPTNQTGCLGGSVSFTVAASGTGLTYQWRKGTTNLSGGNISGATSPTVTINPVAAGDVASNYNVVVTGTCSPAATSNNVSLSVDATPPGITAGGTASTLGCNPSATDINAALGTATATDAISTPTVTSSDGSVSSTGCGRSQTRTFTARDACNNSSTAARTVTWTEDNTPPGFTGSYADVNLGCNPANPAGSLGTATATDFCTASPTITSSDGPVVSTGCNRSQTRTFTATDACNKTSTTSRTVNWTEDNTPPGFTGNYADVNLGCNPANPSGSLGTASATDFCTASPTITPSDGPVVSNGCNRSQTRTFTATDACNKTSTTSRTVNWIEDITPPGFTGNYADVNLGCNPANPSGSLGTATATDFCTASPTITPSDGPVVSNGCNRSQTRTFTATDACNKTSTTSRTVNWIEDITPPGFTGDYSDVNLGCNPANPSGSLGTASATDFCTASPTITSSDGPVVSTGCNRSQTRTFTATDACNKTSTTSRTVTWTEDNTPPGFTGSYADVNLGCNPADPDGSLGTATATDDCGAVTITSSDGAVVSDGCNRARTRTFTATDGCLNTSTTSRTVRWISDNTPPAFTGNYVDITIVVCNPANPQSLLGTATATDACGDVTITSFDSPPVFADCSRFQTRTFTARDGCNNTSTISRTVRWTDDNTPPGFTGSYADVNLGCNPANPDGSLGTATATDGCGAVIITSSDGAVVSDGCNRSRTRTFTANDACGNSSSTSRTVRWISDNTPPAFTGSYADVNLGCNPANPDGSLGTATATDVCGAVTITSSDGAVVTDGCNRSRTRTFTATDGCLNTSTTSRTVRWIYDHTPATFTGSYADVNLGCNPPNPDGSLGSASATDVCGAVTITQSDGAVVTDGCNRSRTRTFTATDGCLNTSTTSRTVRWISDNTPPAFTGSYADVNLGCNPADPDGSLGSASATDVCGAVTITQSDGAVVTDGCNRSRTRTFTATDDCLNTSTTSRTVRWIYDHTPATFTGSYADVNLGCNPANPDGSLGSASATDVCGAVTITQSDGAVVTDGCNRSRTRTFTATDGCLNTSTTSRTVRWIYDHTPATFTGSYADVNLGCNPGNPDGSLGSASATDVCGAVTITQSDGAVVTDGCNRSRTRTFTATDGCLNTSTTSRTVRWISDNTPATFTGSYADVNLGCNPTDPDGSLGTATATDVCGAVTITSSDGAVVTDGCNRSRTRTFTATDGCLNTSTTSRTVRWIADVTPPAFTGSYADVNLGCNPANPDGSLGTATATDVCGAVTITSSDGAVVTDGCNRSRTRTFTATDGCLNTSTTSRTVRWIADVTPPAFTGSYADVNLGCNPANPDGSLGTATATDVCGAVTITSSDGAVVTDGCNRSRTRTFTATDGCLNTSTTSRTVRWISDVTPPTFTGSYSNVNLGCNAKAGNITAALDGATATDACGGTTVTQSDGSVVSTECVRSQTRTFTARDGCGNTATISRTVTWTEDLTPPIFTGTYTNVDLGCNPTSTAITAALDGATATDACGTTTVTSKDGTVTTSGCVRTQTRTFTAKDGCNNTATVSRTVTWVVDLTPPTFTGSYADVNLGCNPGDPAGSLGTATATDVCGAVTITHSDGGVVSAGCDRSIKRTFTAKDGCNNTSTTSRTVRWIADITPPVFTGSYADVNLGCNPANPDGSLGTATATDVCGAVTITSSDGSVVSNGCDRSRTRTFTAADGCLNTSTTSRTVRWISDVTPPTFSGSYSNVNLGCNPKGNDVPNALDGATATDACGDPTITQSDGSVSSNGCNRSQTRTFTAKDACGNTSTISRTVTWIVDVTPPTFTGNYNNVPLGCNPSAGDISGALGSSTATDACGVPTIISFKDDDVTSNGCSRSQTRTFFAKDGCENISTISRTATWTADLTAPTITTGGGSLTLGCNPSAGDINASLGTATATDACGAPTMSVSDGSVSSNGCSRSQTRTWTARDACGNTSTASRTVTWTSDVTPPTAVVGGTNLNLGCNPTASDINSALGTATATDACGVPTISVSDGSVSSNGCNRSQTRTFVARDACGNMISATRTAVWTSDLTPPTITCPAAAPFTRSTNAGVCTYKIVGAEFNATATDACTAYPIMSYCITNPNATTITGTGSLAGKDISFGSNTIKWTATDGCNNSSTCSFTVNVNNIATVATVTVSPSTQQYSDKVTFTATVTPYNCTGAGAIGGQVKFKIGTMVIGTAAIASDGTATLTAPLLEDQLYDADLNDPLNATSGPLDPQINPKTVTACFENIDAEYTVTNPTTSLTVNCENADITYNGQTYFTVNPNTLAGTVNLSAYGLDINDVPPQARGDIRNAVAKFREGGPGGTVRGEADSIPFGLIFPGNYQEGIATTFFNDVLTNAEASGGGKVYQMWVGGGNYYCGGMADGDRIPVTLAMPGQDFVTGGGYTVFTATNPSAGTYAGTIGKRMNFGFVMKWNPSGANLQGQVNVIFRRVVSGVTRIYQIKSNAINSLVVQNVNDAGAAATGTNVTFRKATIATKATLKDITDPLNEISLGGNLSLTVVAWESTTVNTGALDRITVQLNGSGSLGLLFANSWSGASATWQTLTGGKIQVRNASTPPPGQRINTTTTSAQTPEVIKSKPTPAEGLPFNVKAFPNPTEHQFTLYLEGASNEKVAIVVYDAIGRQVKKIERGDASGAIKFGEDLKVGVYIVEVRQGDNRKTLKLVKQ